MTDDFDPEQQVENENVQYEKVSEAEVNLDAQVRRTKQAYKSVFNNASPDDIEFVLLDLALMSKAYSVRFNDNESDRMLLVREGRAQLFFHIMDALELDHASLYAKYRKTLIQQGN